MSVTRESKQFWAVDGNTVKKITGFACPPNKGMWWTPELGWSGEEGYHLFNTKQEAQDVAITELEEEINYLQKTLAKMKRKRAKSK